ncbi:BSD domain-containing protein 1-like [Salvelinus fontinalis]|uniref:BSD domain-containing protein 1-like n=1 Tax=Salvelinus fontinalis TaxID=8038 RepID=UPI002485AE9B|nr:BSD domain-containing protein 1-like [Salvelinus fontinalis]
MAEGESCEGWWGGWLQQSFQAVKDKSSEAYEFIKRDLTEFSNVVQHDAACSIVATASAVRSKLAVEGSSDTTEKVKKSLSSFLGVITDTLAPPQDMTIDCDVITLVATPAGTTEVYDSTKARLYSLQADPATYCNEPDGSLEQFDAWLSSFSLEERKGEISDLLVNTPSIRALYTRMVPAAVAHSEFWQRYFYKVFQLDQEEARRLALKQRAEQTTHTEALGWEEEDEDDFLGATSSSRLDFTPPLDDPTTQLSPLTPVTMATTPLSPIPSPSGERSSPLSLSSDSGSLPTQVEVRPARPQPVVVELSQKFNKSSLEERKPEGQQEEEKRVQLEAPAQPEPTEKATAERITVQAPATTVQAPATTVQAPATTVQAPATTVQAPATTIRPETEGPQDLRVFELNSDSGKSTPSNNGKKGSSTDVSEDWEKDFDLDMTEDEVQMVLSRVEATGELEENWENWN